MTEPTAKSSSATGANGLKFIVLGERRLFAALIAENDSRERTCQLVLEIEFHGERPAIWPANRDGDWFLTNLRLEDLKSSPLTISKLAAQSEPWSCFISDVAIAPPSVRSDAPTPAAPIVENVGFRVLRVVYFRPMIETIAPPASPLSLCLLFGRDDEAHLIHLRFRDPDFDRIATLEGAPIWLSSDILCAGAILVLSRPPGVAGPTPFIDGENVILNYRGRDMIAREVRIKRARWFSTDSPSLS